LLSTLTFIINNIIRVSIIKVRIANTIEVILNIIRIGNITKTKTKRVTRTIVVTRLTTRTNRTVSKAGISVVDLALSLV